MAQPPAATLLPTRTNRPEGRIVYALREGQVSLPRIKPLLQRLEKALVHARCACDRLRGLGAVEKLQMVLNGISAVTTAVSGALALAEMQRASLWTAAVGGCAAAAVFAVQLLTVEDLVQPREEVPQP